MDDIYKVNETDNEDGNDIEKRHIMRIRIKLTKIITMTRNKERQCVQQFG